MLLEPRCLLCTNPYNTPMPDSSVRTYDCPSPDCEFATGGAAELSEHVNTEHAGEYQREDWPDTDAGRATRDADREDSEE